MIKKHPLFFTGLVVFIATLGVHTLHAGKRPIVTAWSLAMNIDPAQGSDQANSTALVNLYDPLLFPDENLDPKPHVAERWESSPDGMTHTFHIRRGITFHDGSELTAEDVKFSMDRTNAIGKGLSFLYKGNIREVTTPGTYTVVFKMAYPFGPFIKTLYNFFILNKKLIMANIVKAGKYGAMGDYGTQFLLNHDAGSGAYIIKEIKPREKVVMTLNRRYWQTFDSNIPDEYIMISVKSPADVKRKMSKRELDISDPWQTQHSLKELAHIDNVQICSYLTSTEFYYMINTKKAPTDDIHFRKAMAYAFDYDMVVKDIYPDCIVSKGPVPQFIPGAAPVSYYKRDLQEAKKELKLSKYADELGKHQIVVKWSKDVPEEGRIADLFMLNMDEIGINVTHEPVEWMDLVQEMKDAATSPHIVTIFTSAYYPEAGSLLQSRYSTASCGTWQQNEWLQDEKYEALLKDAFQTADQRQRFQKYAEIQQYIVDLCPTLFIFDFVQKQAYQSYYIDWGTARGKYVPVEGYSSAGIFFRVYPEKRRELMKKTSH